MKKAEEEIAAAKREQKDCSGTEQAFMRSIISLHDKYVVYVESSCFNNNSQFHKALKEASLYPSSSSFSSSPRCLFSLLQFPPGCRTLAAVLADSAPAELRADSAADSALTRRLTRRLAAADRD